MRSMKNIIYGKFNFPNYLHQIKHKASNLEQNAYTLIVDCVVDFLLQAGRVCAVVEFLLQTGRVCVVDSSAIYSRVDQEDVPFSMACLK